MRQYLIEIMLTVKVSAEHKTQAQDIVRKSFRIDENSDMSTSNIKILDVKEAQ